MPEQGCNPGYSYQLELQGESPKRATKDYGSSFGQKQIARNVFFGILFASIGDQAGMYEGQDSVPLAGRPPDRGVLPPFRSGQDEHPDRITRRDRPRSLALWRGEWLVDHLTGLSTSLERRSSWLPTVGEARREVDAEVQGAHEYCCESRHALVL